MIKIFSIIFIFLSSLLYGYNEEEIICIAKISMKEPMYKVIVESLPDIIAKNGFANINTKNNQTMN